jgi:hypothetical protein
MDNQQHPQLQARRYHSCQAGQAASSACAISVNGIATSAAARKHPEIGVDFAVARKRFEIDRLTIDSKFAMKQMNQHVVKGSIQHLWGKELEFAVAQKQEIVSSDDSYQGKTIPIKRRGADANPFPSTYLDGVGGKP